MGKYIKGNIEENLDLGTLASKTLIADTFDETVEERTFLSSIVVSWSLDQLTAPQGPISFGVAHSDYSDAEIEQVLEAVASWKEGDKIAQEVSKRLVKQIGVFVSPVGAAGGITDVSFNDGRPKKTKLNWILTSGKTLKMWAYNDSASALVTTAPFMRANGHANLWPR